MLDPLTRGDKTDSHPQRKVGSTILNVFVHFFFLLGTYLSFMQSLFVLSTVFDYCSSLIEFRMLCRKGVRE